MKRSVKILSSSIVLIGLFLASPAEAQRKKQKEPTYKVEIREKYNNPRDRHRHKVVQNRPYSRQNHAARVQVVYPKLPHTAQKVYLDGRMYYHHNHNFYQPYVHGGFVWVQPPEYIHRLPKRVTRVYHRGAPLYFFNGVYVKYTPYGYVITTPL